MVQVVHGWAPHFILLLRLCQSELAIQPALIQKSCRSLRRSYAVCLDIKCVPTSYKYSQGWVLYWSTRFRLLHTPSSWHAIDPIAEPAVPTSGRATSYAVLVPKVARKGWTDKLAHSPAYQDGRCQRISNSDNLCLWPEIRRERCPRPSDQRMQRPGGFLPPG
ncbi:hypothetical protein BDV93DRAFT_509369 [Ceratobasidium sp. AG-I]|nr:hypothetical protein BDV93DRAFT_509369 [Ceratobasidium sp. AG-I]